MKVNKEKLLKNGYTKYNQPEDEPTLYQKKVKDKKGIKYFINCYHYIYPKSSPVKDAWEFKLQTDTALGTVNITLFNTKCTIKIMEEFMERTWMNYGLNYYELFVSQEKSE